MVETVQFSSVVHRSVQFSSVVHWHHKNYPPKHVPPISYYSPFRLCKEYPLCRKQKKPRHVCCRVRFTSVVNLHVHCSAESRDTRVGIVQLSPCVHLQSRRSFFFVEYVFLSGRHDIRSVGARSNPDTAARERTSHHR